MAKHDIPLEACVAFDFETCLIRPGLTAPPIVCMTVARGEHAEFLPTADVGRRLAELLADERALILGHNVAYDFSCALEWYPHLREAIYAAYDADRVLDTLLCQRLIEIETGDMRGKLALDQLCQRYGLHHESKGAIDDETGNAVRLSYGRYLGAPLEAYPPEFVTYAIDDARLTLKLFGRMLQRGLVARRDLAMLCRDDLALKLVAAEGLITDAERVELLEQATIERRGVLQSELLKAGALRLKREKGVEKATKTVSAVQRRVAEAFELPYRVEQKTPKHQPQIIYTGDDEQALRDRGLITEAGRISTARLVLEESGDPVLAALAEYGEWQAVWNKDLPAFRFSASTGRPLHTRFGFAATTRTTSGGGVGGVRFNQQNQRKTVGLRECFVAPDGGAFVATDFSGLENATLAQVIAWNLGRRTLCERYSAGFDEHSDVGRHMIAGVDRTTLEAFLAMRKSDDAAIAARADECRSAAKPLNFGLPGYMTRPETVQSYARIGYGVNRPVEFWREMIDLWYATQTDKVAYLREYVDSHRCGDRTYNIPIPATTITRRGATRTAAGNTPFQGLGARVALRSLYQVVRAQMLGRMPGRACAFIHDEIISHTRGSVHENDVQHLRELQEQIMISAAGEVMPDIRMRAESVAMRHWSKKAQHVERDGKIKVYECDYRVDTKKKAK